MKIILGPPPAKDFLPTGNYQKIFPNEFFTSGTVTAISVVAAIAGYFLFPQLPVEREIISHLGFYITVLIILTCGVIVAHEVVHLIVSPGGFKGKNASIGVHPRKMMFYAYTEAQQSRAQSLVMLLSPVVALTVIPFIFMALTAVTPAWLWGMAFINLSLSANDLVIAAFVFFCVPKNAVDVQPQFGSIWFRGKMCINDLN